MEKELTKLNMNLQYFAEGDPEPEPEVEPEVETDPEPEPEVDQEPEKKPEQTDPEPEVEPEAKPEKDAESQELKELRKKLEEAQEYKTKYEEAQTFKTKYEQTQESLKGYEASLEKIAQEKIEAMPEEFRGLVPDGDTTEQLDWLAKAEKSGLFKVKEEKSIGGSTKLNPEGSNEVEPVEMTANQKMIAGIKDFYSKATK